MKIIRITLFAILFPLLIVAHQYELSIATIFQNEAKYFDEWIQYHQLVGVEHFYLYNNGSVDNYLEVLKPYIKKGVVEVIDFPNIDHKSWNYGTQPACYRAALDRARGVSKWLCIIDVDEFIVPMQFKTITKELRSYPQRCKAVYPNWFTFGTSHKYVQDGDWIITELTYRARRNHPNNRHGKSIVQPQFVVSCVDPHFVELKHPFGYFDGSGNELKPGVHDDHLRIHHYTFRDESFMRGEKTQRVLNWGHDPEKIYEKNEEYNEVEDISILRLLQKQK